MAQLSWLVPMEPRDPGDEPARTPELSKLSGLSRRRFLIAIGTLAGTAVIGPLLTRPTALARADTTRSCLGTWVRIVARHENEAVAARAVDRAFAAIATVDAQMSVHRPDSQLSRINASAGERAIAVDAGLTEVLAMALDGARRTSGLYDPTVLPLMRAFGFDGATAGSYPSNATIDAAMAGVGWKHVTVDRVGGTVGLARRGAGLDLGSIGKGWAVDRAVEALRHEGIRAGLVDAGGNVYAFGSPGEGAEGWTVGVLHPVTRRVDRVFTLRDRAVATSGNAEQFRLLDGVRVGHLFDARSGRPANGHLSASVLARTAVAADLMSTSAFLLGPDRFHWPEAEAVHFVG